METSAERDKGVHFAAERAFLVQILTGFGLMGVGFAVALFVADPLADARGPKEDRTLE